MLPHTWDADSIMNIDLEEYRALYPYPYFHFLPAIGNLIDRPDILAPLHLFRNVALFAVFFGWLRYFMVRFVFTVWNLFFCSKFHSVRFSAFCQIFITYRRWLRAFFRIWDADGLLCHHLESFRRIFIPRGLVLGSILCLWGQLSQPTYGVLRLFALIETTTPNT